MLLPVFPAPPQSREAGKTGRRSTFIFDLSPNNQNFNNIDADYTQKSIKKEITAKKEAI